MVPTLDPETLSDESDAIVADVAKLFVGKTPDLIGFVLAELLAMYLSEYPKESRREMMRLHVVTALALAEFYEPDHALH